MHPIRPKNLNLFTIKFPLPAIISILHRISGTFLFLIIPLLLWALHYSLTEQGFADFQRWLDQPWAKIIFWVIFAPFLFHLIAGLRHLLMDINIGTSLRGGRFGALLVIVISLIAMLLTGIWLW